MVDRSTQLGVVQIAALLRKDKGDVSRAAARGDFGRPVIRKGGTFKRYTLAGIQKAAGRTFTPSQIAAAQAAHDNQSPRRSALLLDFASALLTLRDFQWCEHLAGQGLIAGANYSPLPPRKDTP